MSEAGEHGCRGTLAAHLAHPLSCMLLATLGWGCASVDEQLLDEVQSDASLSGAGGTPATPDEPIVDTPDAAVPPDASTEPTADVGCVPNDDEFDEVCRQICPEICNGQDDDCDRLVDEGAPEDTCVLGHAQGVCLEGSCLIVGCDDGFRDCDGEPDNGCEAPLADPDNCGSCGLVCAIEDAVEACFLGSCVIDHCEAGHGDCDEDASDCEAPLDTFDHCGGCGIACGDLPNAVPTCAMGACGVDRCEGNFGDCDGVADNGCETSLDVGEHCGGCGIVCDPVGGQGDCGSGICLTDGCDDGFGDCDGDATNGCEPLDTSADCGACGTTCDTSLANVAVASCEGSGCTVTCEDGYGDCNGDSGDGCELRLDSIAHCGGCDIPCAFDHAVADCASGSCELVRCADGYGDCDQQPDDCEQPLDQLDHCGACGDVCDKVSCGGGVCSSAVCTAPEADCDGVGGCEIDLSDDLAHCGACDSPCEFDVQDPHASVACVDSGCALTCDAGYDDCDGDPRNGCETDLDSMMDCGACDSVCSAPNGIASCSAGTCVLDSCEPDWDDCDGDGLSCETRLDSTAHCGACDAGCDLPDAVEACSGVPGDRACTVAACEDADFADCDGQPDNGCEVDTRSATANCSSCGLDCGAQPQVLAAACVDSSCNIVECVAGYGDCNQAPGCETDLASPQHCGGCGQDCDDALANTTSTGCGVGLSCEVVSCAAGFADCDGDHGNGCETSTHDVANCGGCTAYGENQDCDLPGATAVCPAGMCEVDACDSDYLDCDGLMGNGCEQQLSVDGPCIGFPYPPSNFDPAVLPQGLPDVNLDCGDQVGFDSATMTFSSWCAGEPMPEVVDAVDVVILAFGSLQLGMTTQLGMTGDRPVIVAVVGDAAIDGTLHARGVADVGGAGANSDCGTGAGGQSGHKKGGGGGAGFGGSGADGGGSTSGDGAAAWGEETLSPLRGGCSGGNGQNGSSDGGGGGGGLQLSVAGVLTVAGVISASGGGGQRGSGSTGSGGGGGSGGGVLIEADEAILEASAFISANGGGGAGGQADDGGDTKNGQDGDDGEPASAARAQGGNGGNGDDSGGDGGDGGSEVGPAQSGGGPNGSDAGGAGGGGGVGRIHIHGASSCTLDAGASPAPSTSGC